MITLTAMIRHLQNEKVALDATIAAVERLVRPQNGTGSKPKAKAVDLSKSLRPRQQGRNSIS